MTDTNTLTVLFSREGLSWELQNPSQPAFQELKFWEDGATVPDHFWSKLPQHISAVELEGFQRVSSAAFQAIGNLPFLKSLEISTNFLGSEILPLKSSSLEDLHIYVHSALSAGAQAAIGELSSLRSLSIYSNTPLGSFNGIEGLTGLETLRLWSQPAPDWPAKLSSLSELKELELDLDGERIDFGFLAWMPQLTDLSIHSANPADAGAFDALFGNWPGGLNVSVDYFPLQ